MSLATLGTDPETQISKTGSLTVNKRHPRPRLPVQFCAHATGKGSDDVQSKPGAWSKRIRLCKRFKHVELKCRTNALACVSYSVADGSVIGT
jgi:hypothetical protein